MARELEKILVIDDKKEYREAAEIYLKSQGLQATLASDYDEAFYHISNTNTSGVLSDVFFPKKIGSNDLSLGKALVKKMALNDPSEIANKKSLEEIGKYINLDDSLALKYAKYLNSIKQSDSIAKNFKEKSKPFDEATTEFKEVFSWINDLFKLKHYREQIFSNYDMLLDSFSESEFNQPLGLQVYRDSEKINLPCVLVTSTDSHDKLSVPIINYCKRNNLDLVQCYARTDDDKENPLFWEKPFGILKQKILKGGNR